MTACPAIRPNWLKRSNLVHALIAQEATHAMVPDGSGGAIITCDRRDDANRPLTSGVYFCRIEVAGETITRKMVIVRRDARCDRS